MRLVKNSLTLSFHREDEETASIVAETFDACSGLIADLWGVPVPVACHAHIMTSWQGFVVQSTPWYWLPLLAITLPLWAGRAARIWPLAGGWELSWGNRRAIGVKPPRLLEHATSPIGREIFEPETSMDEKLRAIVCHELTHAFTAHLKLPVWLKEGLAMVTVDHYLGRETVRRQTLQLLARSSGRLTPKGRARLDLRDRENLVYLYALGYWLTRYLVENDSGQLRSLLSRRRTPADIEMRIAEACDLSVERYRATIDLRLAAHFAGEHPTFAPDSP